MVDRRSFLRIVGGIAATAVPASSLAVSRNGENARILIIGAGVAGIRAAVRLKQCIPGVDVTLIEPARHGKAGMFAKLNRAVDLESADSLVETRINVLSQHVIEVDPVCKHVRLQDGTRLTGDLLVLAPGVEFKRDNRMAVHPLNDSLMQQRIEQMRDGDTVIASIPKAPYQYPQGPYINISKAAEYLHASKSGSKIIVLDHNGDSSMAELYRRQWTKGVATSRIEHIAVAKDYIQSVDEKTGTLVTVDGTLKGDVIALMDEQHAASVARKAGLAKQSDWCHVNAGTLESLHYPEVYVLGDANDAAQNDKTAFSAVQQADAFVREIAGRII